MDLEGASPARGGEKGLANLFKKPIRDLINPEELLEIDDPQCEFQAPLGRQHFLAVVILPPVVIRTADSPVAKRYEAEFQRLDLDLAKLKAKEKDTDYDNVLQQNISGPGTGVKYTATSAAFLVPPPADTLDVAATAPMEIPIPKLLDSTLEPAA